VKVVKNRAYFKRFQVKFRRRRECKTDYYARKRLIMQDKNKYNAPKYRFVFRKTHRDLICQIFSSDLTHDVCLAAAYAHELPRYGIKNGLTNYASAYATGLLLARRVNKKLRLHYEGNSEIDGTDFNVEAEEGARRPFKALLDVGLQRTTTGARIFGALKGAVDGGLNIPHSANRFPGTPKDGGEEPDPKIHRSYIFAGHVADYMKKLKKEPAAYQRQFSRYIKAKINPNDLEEMYTKAHEQIRAEPFRARGPLEKGYFGTRTVPFQKGRQHRKKHWKSLKKDATTRRKAVEKLIKKHKLKRVIEEHVL